MGASIAIKS